MENEEDNNLAPSQASHERAAATDSSQASTDSPPQALSDRPSPDAVLLKALGSRWIWWFVWLCLFLPFHFTNPVLEQSKTYALIGMPGILLLWSIFTSKKIWKGALRSLLLIPLAIFALCTLLAPYLSTHQVDKETKNGKYFIRELTHSYLGSSMRELVAVSQPIAGIEVHRRIATTRYWFLWRKIDDKTIEWQETGFLEWRDDLPKTLFAL